MGRFTDLIREIHRRSVWQVLGVYVVASWGVLEAVETLTSGLGLPTWFPGLAFVLLLVGLPVVLATAVVQEGPPALASPGAVRDAPAVGEPAAGAPVVGENAAGAPAVGENAAGAPAAGDPARPSPAAAPGGIGRLFTWRNAVLGGVAALALWGVLAAGWLLAGDRATVPFRAARAPSTPAELSSGRLAVLPFQFRGDDALSYLEEGMVTLLSTKLDGVAGLRVVDPRALLGVVSRRDASAMEVETASTAARELGAGLFVLGDIVEAAGRLSIHVTLHRAGREDPLAEASTEGGTDQVFAMVDEIAGRLLASATDEAPTRMTRVASFTTSSLPAFKAFLEGETALRAARFREAFDGYQRAVTEDSLFALAFYRLSIAAEWLTWDQVAVEAAEHARRHAGRLSERDRRLLEAFLTWRRSEHERALTLYRSHLATWGDDVEAWFQYGEAQFHGNPLHGMSSYESRAAFERVLDYEPDHAAALLHLVRIAAGERRLGALDSLVARFQSLSPEGERHAEALALVAYAKGDSAAERRALDALRQAPDALVTLTVNFLAVYGGGARASLAAARVLTDPGRSDRARAVGHIYAAHSLLGLGRRREALSEMREAERLAPILGREMSVHIALLPFQPAGPQDLAALRSALTGHAGEELEREGESVNLNPHSGFRHAVHPYLLGLLSAALGDSAGAMQRAEVVRAADVKAGAGSLTEDMARALLAEVHIERGRLDAALAELQGIRHDVFFEVAGGSPYAAQARERFLLAELSRSGGDLEGAMRWYRVPYDAVWDLPYRPLAELRLGEILEGQGQVDEAADRYRRTLELLQGADPEYQEWKAEASRGLARLAAE